MLQSRTSLLDPDLLVCGTLLRTDLRAKLKVAAGGAVFSTVQKFFPEERGDRHPVLSDRRNIIVMADEAHRSQYDFIDGFARHMRDALPKASFIGFTGTPIEQADANTRAVFDDYISVYDIQQAVIDGAAAPIYYDSRLAKLALKDSELPKVDSEFEEATEGEEVERKEELKSRWAQLEAVVGLGHRVKVVAHDLVEHFENRLAAMDGKALVVCMSRRICVDLYREIVALRPAWDHADDESAALKIVMTGSASDPIEWQARVRSKSRRESLAARFRNSKDPFKVVIVSGYVAHRLRRSERPYYVRRQADARPRAHAGHRPSEPGFQGQARRFGRRLSGIG